MRDRILEKLNQNLARVESLVVTYETHPDAQGAGRKRHEVLDVLRAAVVLLHASLEEILRDLAYWKLPNAAPDVLNRIPWVGHTPSKKLALGEIANHRGKTVDEIMTESVNAHLERSNFNSVTEMSALLESVGIDVGQINARFTDLQALMDRRHQIVHRADRQQTVIGRGDHQIRAINKEMVRGWTSAVEDFGGALNALL